MDEILQDRYKKLVKQMVEEGSLPRALFKYRSLSSINTYKIFINKELHFSAPKDFNDPFDCKINALISDKNEFARSFEKDCSNVNVASAIENRDNINDTIERVVNKKGICSFSRTKDNILMWSHYANSHRGICLEFDITEDYEFFTLPINIKYEEFYPEIDVSKTRNNIGEKLLSTKYKGWQYEQEVRIYKNAPGKYKFNPKSLKAVYFGCKVEDKIDELCEFIRGIGCFDHVEFYKGEMSKTKYKIEFNKYKPESKI